QSVERHSYALVWGVNVFHLARRLDDTLLEALAALVPGGWLVVGEGLRPGINVPVGAELPFQLLDSFHDVVLDAATRPTAGFLTAELWIDALRRTGFDDIALVPDVIALRESYPGFLAAAVCGRGPPRGARARPACRRFLESAPAATVQGAGAHVLAPRHDPLQPPANLRHPPTFALYFLGFRCAQDP